ncbi:MAG: NUDIX hydrolase [Pseudomonadota bacterium]
MIRRFGEPYQASKRYTYRPGAYAILWDGHAILTTFQAEPEPEYQLPGGGIDPGETPIQALHREVREETGWKIANPRRLGAFRRFVYMPEYDLWAEKLCHIYLARPVTCSSPPLEPGHSAVWMEPNSAVSLLGNPGDRAFLTDWIASAL